MLHSRMVGHQASRVLREMPSPAAARHTRFEIPARECAMNARSSRRRREPHRVFRVHREDRRLRAKEIHRRPFSRGKRSRSKATASMPSRVNSRTQAAPARLPPIIDNVDVFHFMATSTSRNGKLRCTSARTPARRAISCSSAGRNARRTETGPSCLTMTLLLNSRARIHIDGVGHRMAMQIVHENRSRGWFCHISRRTCAHSVSVR